MTSSSASQAAVKSRVSRAMISSGKRRISDPIRVKVVSTFSITSGTNAFNQSVTSLTPVGAQDFSSFAALFDEVRCTRIDFDAAVLASSAPAPIAAGWAFAWDPSNIGVYSNVPDALTAEHHVGPVALPQQDALASPLAETPSGLYHLSVPVHPQRLTGDGSISGDVGGGWFATGTSATNAVVGYIKSTIPALGTGVTSTFYGYAAYHLEFRNRT